MELRSSAFIVQEPHLLPNWRTTQSNNKAKHEVDCDNHLTYYLKEQPDTFWEALYAKEEEHGDEVICVNQKNHFRPELW